MMKRLLVATRSSHKLAEIHAILGTSLRIGAGITLELLDLDAAGVAQEPEEEHIETFDSFRENALAKARYFADRSGTPTIADDSGIVVDALDGAPGVRSRRFSGRDDLAGSALDAANNRLLLERLDGVPDHLRNAHYVCAAALVLSDGQAFVTLGTCAGRILHRPAGDRGFGYDPLFHLPTLDRTFGELDAAEKHRLSHRGCAFRSLASLLPDLARRL